ncbi:MAG: T9SS type A sorting domain-containing protein [Bacteroidetes bacterium]|nr:MAG: T9SS type A sorting domain-containing protein [Bacteroidota bacterium]
MSKFTHRIYRMTFNPKPPPFLVIFLFLFHLSTLKALERKVLFLGNSYTHSNNLPQLLSDYANSVNDSLLFDESTPGGYTLDQHFTNLTSTGKIMSGGWDYVVMQEQSQLPSFQDYLSAGPQNLSALIVEYNPCARKMFYMTWGRKNGDASNCPVWPPVCTYEGMDSLLYLRYLEMASQNNAEVSPVGYLWRYIRQNYPAIELYWTDGSHPSLAGSYAAAACFYSVIFRKDPTQSTFNPGIDSTEAAIIRQTAKLIVYDSLTNWDFSNHQPLADFSYTIGTGINEVIISNRSLNSDFYLWDWGDGTTSTTFQPAHSYSSIGTYTITLTASNCDLGILNDSIMQKTVTFCTHDPRILPDSLILCPNSNDTLWTQAFDSYQWLDGAGIPLPGETNQYLIPATGQVYSVQTTLNNCTERSPEVYVSDFSSGFVIYRVDSSSTSTRIDSLCVGDTVLLVLQPNRPGGNDFTFQWHINGNEIPAAVDDSLFVTSSGDYQVKVHNLHCPSYLYYENTPLSLNFLNCVIGVDELSTKNNIKIFPNPANDYLNILNNKPWDGKSTWKIIDLTGRIVQTGEFHSAIDSKIKLEGLITGVYFVDCRDKSGIYRGKFIVNK